MLDRFLQDPMAVLADPRIVYLLLFWAVMAGAALLMYVGTEAGRHSVRGFLRYCVPPGTLSHPSARADFLFWLSRRLVYPLFVVPLVLSPIAVGYALHAVLASWIGAPAAAGTPASAGILLLFTAVMVVASDLAYYGYHRAAHSWPILWELHKVHHSAEVMVGTTKDRIHPVEDVVNALWNGIVQGVVYAAWLFFYDGLAEITIVGLNVYLARNLLMLDFIRHTHLKLSYGAVFDRILLSPHAHQLHHSENPRHYNLNYGLALSVWDRLFGTWLAPAPGEDFRFGLGEGENREYRSVLRLYWVPVRNIGRIVVSHLGSPTRLGADGHR
jgi:sterol desaturase/sphingolipid hydroxylase (fatty acid hydroxylase superfamily)